MLWSYVEGAADEGQRIKQSKKKDEMKERNGGGTKTWLGSSRLSWILRMRRRWGEKVLWQSSIGMRGSRAGGLSESELI